MNNHLSYRWPETPVSPAPAPKKPKQKKKHRGLRTFRIILACVIGIAALVAGAYFGIIYAAERFAAQVPQASDAPPVSTAPTQAPPSFEPGIAWTPEDFPWGEPDPSTEVTFSQPAQQPLTPQAIYEQALPSVVYVHADRGGTVSAGSGIILTESGYIVTNYHVVEGAVALSVMLLPDEQIYNNAKLIGFDEELDIAVLKIDAEGLTPAAFADSDLLSVGDAVYAIGNPMGYLYGTMTDGIVSSLARLVEVGDQNMTLIQTSVALNSGNSGGALINSYGQVVGINVAKITGIRGDAVVEGIGLAIPITDALPFINHIIHTGTSVRPSLGIMCYEARIDGQKGILVDETTPGTPAAKGLKAGDFIIAANGKLVGRLHELTRILYATGVGNEVKLTVIRGARELIIPIRLYDRLTE